MTTTNRQTVTESGMLVENSGVQYKAVTYTDGKYAPTRPFKGFICAVAGNVNIVGLDGASCVLPVMVAGVTHACAGIMILEASTVATGIVAVF